MYSLKSIWSNEVLDSYSKITLVFQKPKSELAVLLIRLNPLHKTLHTDI